ncbi:MAG: ATP-binding domain-containing protein [Bacteroidia bacterium]|nr:ATP-binding domain-containing protein [Bacteroidia bacterium]
MAKFKFRLPSQDDIRNSTNGQIMLSIINNDYDEKFSLVTGCPGSGKTTVSIFRLIRLLKNRKPAILLTYQRMLKVAIENLLAKQGISNNKVNTIHSWFPSTTKRLLGYELDETDFKISYDTSKSAYKVFSRTKCWYIKKEYIDQAKSNGWVETDYSSRLTIQQGVCVIYDRGEYKFYKKLSAFEIENALRGKVGNMELILDEAQDLEERIFQAFPKVFGRMTIGADNDQQVHEGSGASETIIKQEISHSLNEFTLQFNYRNTYQIYNFARYFVPNSPKANDSQTLSALKRYKNNGDLPEVLKFSDQSDMQSRLKTIIENYKGFNIGVLFPFKNQVENYHSIISGFGFECSKYYSEMSEAEKSKTENDLKNILVTTFISAKGMEFDIVIMPEFESLRNTDEAKRQAYVGCTRAKNRLVIMYTGSKPSILNNFPSDTYDTGDLFY